MSISGGLVDSGGGRNDENVGAWLLCLLNVGSTVEVAPPISGSGVSSLLAKASMLLHWLGLGCVVLFVFSQSLSTDPSTIA